MSDASVKVRTWPYSVCDDPATPGLSNTKGPDTVVVFYPGVSRGLAQQACEALNRAFDLGKMEGQRA